MVTLLEAAKRQGQYQPLLEAVLQAQPTWADHGRPNPDLTFEIAKSAGLDIFVNGCSLPSFGPDQLAALVAEEVAKAKRKADGGW